jgi:hypothetical protein
MGQYFHTALAVASNNTDVYVGKSWSLGPFSSEYTSLGQFRLTPVHGTNNETVVSDFTGIADYTPNTITGADVFYNGSLRAHAVGVERLQPEVTVAARMLNTEAVFVQTLAPGQQRGTIFLRDPSTNDWVTSDTTSVVTFVNYNYDMVVHTELPSTQKRFIVFSGFSVRHSNANPTVNFATWADGVGFSDGFEKRGITTRPGVTTAVGINGRIRYTNDGVNWSGTTISGGSGVNLNCAAWSQDETVCLAAGEGGALATSTDGETFTLSSALQSTAWGTRRAASIAKDPGRLGAFVVVSNDGAVAETGDYGVTWAVALNCFSMNEYYDSPTPDKTPIRCWVRGIFTYVSTYGGQLFIGTGAFNGVPYTDIGSAFNGYYQTFGTPNITGNNACNVSGSPINAMLAGGLGRVSYITPVSPLPSQLDLGLMNQLISLGIKSTSVHSAYYDAVANCAFVGLSSGLIAYRFNPLSGGSWSFYTITSSPQEVVGFSRLTNGKLMAVARTGRIALGVYSGTTISWSESTSLESHLGGFYASGACESPSETLVSSEGNAVHRTLDGVSWVASTLPLGSSAFKEPRVFYDPRASNGFTSGLFVASYRSDFNQRYVATGPDGLVWDFAQRGSSPNDEGLTTGVFTYGAAPAVSIGIRGDGTGVASTTPWIASSWGTTAGLYNPSTAGSPPPYVVAAPVNYTGAAAGSVNAGYATGRYGRVWYSIDS